MAGEEMSSASTKRTVDLDGVRRWVGVLLMGIALTLASGAGGLAANGGAFVLVLALVGAGLVTYDASAGPAGAGTLFLLVFGLFHAGLVVSYALAGPEVLVGGGDNSWVKGQGLRPAVLATTVGCAALALGFAVATHLASRRGRREPRRIVRSRLLFVGWLSSVGGLAVMAPVLLRAGLDGGYDEFLEASDGSIYGYGTLLLGLGILFLVQAGGRVRIICLVLATPLALFLLALGTRGAVIFATVAVVFLIGKSSRFPWRWFLIVVPVVLGFISVIRQTRRAGVPGLLSGEWEFLPLEGVAEMGYSLYPVYVVDQWMARGLDPWYGLTFISVPLRYWEAFTGRVSPSPDMRLFNVEVGQMAGQIGGSPVAEALRNGGLPFVLLAMGLLGVLLGFLQSRSTEVGILTAAVLLLPLMYFTRNSFGPVPIHMLLGLLLVWLVSTPRAVARQRLRL